MNWLLASLLILHPVMDEPGDLRVVATGVEEPVHWELDGRAVATTVDREPASFSVGAGTHELVARTAHEGPWEAMARPDPKAGAGATYVPAWTAAYVPTPAEGSGFRMPLWAGPVGLALVGLLFWAWPRQAARHPETDDPAQDPDAGAGGARGVPPSGGDSHVPPPPHPGVGPRDRQGMVRRAPARHAGRRMRDGGAARPERT